MSEQRGDRTDVVIRRLAADDWEKQRDARLAALTDAPYAFSSTLASEQGYGEELWRSRAASGRTFGAFDGATIVGLATGIPAEELEGPGAPGPDGPAAPAASRSADEPGATWPAWELVGMWVAPAVRGQGVADQLVEAVCARARQAGAATITLWVTETNARAAAFYRRMGFTPTGARQLVRPDEPDRWELELTRSLR